MKTRNDTPWREAANAYINAKHEAEDAAQKLQEARLTLLELTDTDARGGGVEVKFTERRGSIDYKKALGEIAPDLDVEPYRKATTSVTNVNIAKE